MWSTSHSWLLKNWKKVPEQVETICACEMRLYVKLFRAQSGDNGSNSMKHAKSVKPLANRPAPSNAIQSKNMLTSLPTELRVAILKMSIGEHVFHMSAAAKIAHKCPEAAVSHAEYYCCNQSRQRHVAAITVTCRLLFNEANEILYQQTIMVFASTEAIAAFFQDRIPALHHIRCLSLNCGPAKHLSPASKSEKRRAMRLLRKYASNLDEIRLSFNSYHGIHCDQQLMSNFWLHNIGRLRGLKHFSLHINLDTLGPIGAAELSTMTRARTQMRINQAETALRSRVCEPRGQWERICSKATAREGGSCLRSANEISLVTFASKVSEPQEQL